MKMTGPRVAALGLLSLLMTAAGCKSFSPGKRFVLFPGLVHAPSAQSDAAALFAEMGGEEAFLDLARYLYRWHLDEDDFKRFAPERKDQLWIRRVQTVADAGDHSRYLEVVFPATGVTATLKKTDYRISELKLNVRSEGYRIVRLSRDTGKLEERPGDFAVLDIDMDALCDRLFETRLETQFSCEALQDHIRADILRQEALLAAGRSGKPETLYFAPVHAVDNEQWVFWEEGKLLFKYSSDIDLDNPDVWTQNKLDVAVYDVVRQTLVSFEEKPCDRRFVTRDQVGRALYNCIVLGQRRTVP